jgi:hypothetical protein
VKISGDDPATVIGSRVGLAIDASAVRMTWIGDTCEGPRKAVRYFRQHRTPYSPQRTTFAFAGLPEHLPELLHPIESRATRQWVSSVILGNVEINTSELRPHQGSCGEACQLKRRMYKRLQEPYRNPLSARSFRSVQRT